LANKVLIIDDDPEFVEAVTNLLDAKGYAVENAADSRRGFVLARSRPPDIILLDVMMTTKSEGFDAARELHKDAALKQIPVIMISGVRKEMNLPFGFEPDDDWLPVKAFLEKPVMPDVLLAAVERHIRR
jgi:DNA-binding response OmpR family regulator